MRGPFEILDTQVHSWELEPTLPWNPISYGGDIKPGGNSMGVPYDRVLHAMDAVGVDAAIIYTTQSYRQPRGDGTFDFINAYPERAIAAHPGRFAAITHLDHNAPDIDELVAGVRRRPGTLAIRVLLVDSDIADLRAGAYDALFAAAARHSVPLFMYISGHIPEAAKVARANPALLLIVDHLGLKQGPLRPPDDPPFRTLPELLEMAALPNVAVKLSGLPTLARTPYPFPDLWPPIHQVLGAFGAGRVMWASDYTRCLPLATYAEDLFFLLHSDQLSATEKEAMFGLTARRLLRWER